LDKENSNKRNKSYNGATPWSPPHNIDESVLHAPAKKVETPLVRRFTVTIDIGFSIGSYVDVNVSVLLKIFLSYALKTHPRFRILPLQGGNQSIAYPDDTPNTKEGIDLYFQHKIVKYGVRGKINVTMEKSIGQMKYMNSAFRSYLNREKVYGSQSAQA
jgi:hypothetical protein